MAAEEVGGDREFRYSWTRGEGLFLAPLAVVSAGLFIVAGVVVPVGWAVLRSGGAGGPYPVPFPWPALIAALILALLLAIEITALTRFALLRRRGRALVTRVGITITDWRGREQRLYWEEITRLRALRWPWLAPRLYPPTLVLYAADRRVAIEHGIEGRDELYNTIVARAGLERVTPQRWALVWSRPGVD